MRDLEKVQVPAQTGNRKPLSFINDTSSLVGLFARDTLECLKYIRQLKEKNVPVFFEKENINTLDVKGEVHLVAMQGVFVVHGKFTNRLLPPY